MNQTSGDHQLAVQAVVVASRMLAQHDLPACLAAVERAHAIGPILHPTLYHEKSKAMDEDAEMLRAALPLWRLAKILEARAATHQSKGISDA